MKAIDWLNKAKRAARSAKLLLDAGDLEGACNRAYYAMFDAARAALTAINALIETQTIRTHRGLIATFSLHCVKTGQIPVDLGRAFNKASVNFIKFIVFFDFIVAH